MARPVGSKNKFNKDMKEAIYRAFHELGGKEYLVNVGKKDPKTFLGLVSKVIPAELNVSGQVLIDLGQAMNAANLRLNDMKTIDAVELDTETPKPLISKDSGDDE